MTEARIASLHVYPIKGCRGVDIDAADVVATGLAARGAGDREWMIVDDRAASSRNANYRGLRSCRWRSRTTR